MASTVPDGYEAYVRIFHPPADAELGGDRSWAEVAARNGRTMHGLAQFHAISTPAGAPVAGDWATFSVRASHSPPEAGDLPEAWFRRLCALLSAHTATPDRALYCVWEGYGGLAPVLSGQPLAELPHRAYFVFEGPLDSGRPWLDWADELHYRASRTPSPGIAFLTLTGSPEADEPGPNSAVAPGLRRQLPNLCWPGDRAWCVASEIDFCWTLVGCSRSAADAVLADSELESRPVEPGDSLLFDGDRINI